MTAPLMPKATAIWLIDNTTLTFEQIGTFCHLHPLEVQAIADEEVIVGMVGHDPITSGQLTIDEIERCQADPQARLQLSANIHAEKKKKKAKYTPVALRHVKPNGIAWLLREISQITDADIIRLLGTTKATIQAIRTKTHKSINEIKPENPAHLGLCALEELNKLLKKYGL
ncbi:MAG: hypothetical protein ACD_16C00080G0024 [uncultured bacterium]|nr:MAG: hypothetical protein ACD_16C00080G0024 [uncultured bacterium]OFW70151.1 MAG: cytoplasmic protein [Alphaproteobacteria bacterium GWC2_42_16]OFW84661.1 MAG: cytoplasmic protein [Alphaproteobacteria bacterium RIFCSPHIGHO2_12_FULL_42_100]OFW85400.1 MAG: cytoplasmic protein [Alphaproteobacteria bacterium RBG_16_42_14]OFW92766.1 MAG: cytoplasmic protein [Alphaproteobacteria bacterium RIFCSPHIGHO2_02_FULL_42_30]OFX01241.1 MAG: cytoplasmic protein [Alphaproteobacteria bacterium RIFCSPLOWO2_02_